VSEATDAYIERERERFVEEWRACCRIASVSGDGATPAIEEMADWVHARAAKVFDHVMRVPIPGQGPLIVGELDGTGDERLVIYTHYDVVDAGDEGEWSAPPFGATIRDGRMYARGACDDKSDVAARLQALEAWLADRSEPPPFSIVWVSEGAEEIGSPGLADALAAHADRLRGDACLWESFLRDEDGRPGVGFGCRGALGVELRLRILRTDQHGAFAPVLRSAPIELARALASLVDERGVVRIAGFDDGVREPTAEERAAAAAIRLPPESVGANGHRPYPPGADEDELVQRLVFAPSLSVGRLSAVANGVPAEATAALRIGLVPDQEPDAVAARLRAHLAEHGHGDVEVLVHTTVKPARSPIDSPFALATLDAARATMGEPIVYPVLIGSGPARLVLDALGAPAVSPAGSLRPTGGIHAADEHASIDDYLDHLRFTVRLLERAAERRLRD
jgi:acetylornithine deacetylase/succinyl-diaminopimelate desuccinylase-like protein